jgi:CubicO group peptidase (beta-lactamase class C family)
MAEPTPGELASEIDAILRGLAEQDRLNGSVLVARGEEVILSRGYGLADRDGEVPNTSRTRFRLGSVTKQFTAMAVMILQAQGKLHVQDSICRYLADCPAAWEEITIHHLLTHTSGMASLTGLPGYERTKATPSPPEETVARFRDLPLQFKPGEQWKYSNSGYLVLGLIVEGASGRSYESVLQEEIFGPLGMADSGYEHAGSGLAVGYGGPAVTAEAIDLSIPFSAGALYSTVEDLYRWDRALSTGRLVSQDLMDAIMGSHAQTTDMGGAGYGYGWYVGQMSGRRLWAHGGKIEGSAALNAIFPDDRVYVIVLLNRQDQNALRVLEAIQAAVLGSD